MKINILEYLQFAADYVFLQTNSRIWRYKLEDLEVEAEQIGLQINTNKA